MPSGLADQLAPMITMESAKPSDFSVESKS